MCCCESEKDLGCHDHCYPICVPGVTPETGMDYYIKVRFSGSIIKRKMKVENVDGVNKLFIDTCGLNACYLFEGHIEDSEGQKIQLNCEDDPIVYDCIKFKTQIVIAVNCPPEETEEETDPCKDVEEGECKEC